MACVVYIKSSDRDRDGAMKARVAYSRNILLTSCAACFYMEAFIATTSEPFRVLFRAK